MEELIKTFHVDVKLILAQLVNFAIVFGVMYKFAYQPLLKALKDRERKIAQGLQDSEAATEKLAEITVKEKEVLKKAKEEARAIIVAAEKQAVKNKEEIIGLAGIQAEKNMKEAEMKIKEEKDKMLHEVKSEIAGLVVAATEKVIQEKMDVNKEKTLLDKALGNE